MTHAGLLVAVLGVLFVLAIGITMVQVIATPLISLLGAAKTAHSRITFAHAFNPLGTTVVPYLGAIIIQGAVNAVDAITLSPSALKAFLARESQVRRPPWVDCSPSRQGVIDRT